MYIKKTTYKDNDPICTITESEVIEDYQTEIRDLFIEAFVEAQDIVKTLWVIDNLSEEEVEFDVEDYFTKEDIEFLGHILPSTEIEWTVLDIKILLGDL